MTTHGGNIHKSRRAQGVGCSDILDFSASINPLGPPKELRAILSRQIEEIIHYPDPEYLDLKEAIAKKYSLDQEQIVVGNGTTELLFALFRVLDSKKVLLPTPCYIDYQKAAEQAGGDVTFFPLSPEKGFELDIKRLTAIAEQHDTIVICTPNNPTGKLVEKHHLIDLAQKFPAVNIIVDEAFLEFSSEKSSVAGLAENIYSLHSLTKYYGIPGLRLGFGVFPQLFARRIQQHLPPWSVNSFASAAGIYCLEDKGFDQHVRDHFPQLKQQFYLALKNFPFLEVFYSEANFFLLRIIDENLDALFLAEKMAEQGILIRVCDNFKGLDGTYFRVAVKTEEENHRFIRCLEQMAPGNTLKRQRQPKKGKSIMFQGTCSNAGKSLLTAALCRILLDDGYSVAPFKAQNMSLNSYVTSDGGEIGRAQVVQAQAARLDPDVRMNPVLLKPSSEIGSQVIVKGKAVGNMSIHQYNSYKKEAWGVIQGCYDSLADEHDVIVLEGAGSPGEVNLKQDDIVNMRMARHAQSPVLLIGDIDRGGTYASFVGIMEVLDQWERDLVAGFVVNKFRGQQSLLQPAHDYVFKHTGKSVLGVVPYLDLNIPEEDSVTFKSKDHNNQQPVEPYIDVALISLPHISNFTDFEPFDAEPDVHIRKVSHVTEYGQPDVVMLPGSKNVFSDLTFLHQSGLAEKIVQTALQGKEVIGICGGYIILGKTISDPHNIENSSLVPSTTGLGLLDVQTELLKEKHLLRKSGCHQLSGKRVIGYEIHHGITRGDETLFTFDDGSSCGVQSSSQRVWGCYLHGLFDQDEFRRWAIDHWREAKGMESKKMIVAPYDIEESFTRLASVVRETLDMDKVYRLLGV